MMIERRRYLDRLVKLKFNGSVKIITGVRRCGKSYLLSKIFYNHLIQSGVDENHVIFIALDSFENEKFHDGRTLYEHLIGQIGDEKEHYIILDEIQLVKGFESIVNSLMRRDNIDVYITGSNSKFLSSDIITEFRGRGTEVNVRPLSFSEYIECVDVDSQTAWRDYLLYGGLPETILKDEEEKVTYLKNLVDVLYVRDIIERNGLRKSTVLNAIFNTLSSSIGSLTNPLRIRNIMQNEGIKVDDETVSTYIKAMNDAYLFEEAHRFDIKGNSFIRSPIKYYSVDLGLRNAKLNFRQNEFSHLMENAIYNELRYRGFNVDVGVIGIREYINGKREYKQLEIDFVANKGADRYYIQSAFNMTDPNKQKQELRPFLKINDGFKKLVIVGDNVPPHRNENGIMIMNIIDFLKDIDALMKV